VRFVDSSIEFTGIDGFEQNVRTLAQRFSAQFTRERVGWILSIISPLQLNRSSSKSLLLAGFDITKTDEQGNVRYVAGFFGDVPQT
jgi:hypothetical protein